jgi:hypothetical protein
LSAGDARASIAAAIDAFENAPPSLRSSNLRCVVGAVRGAHALRGD